MKKAMFLMYMIVLTGFVSAGFGYGGIDDGQLSVTTFFGNLTNLSEMQDVNIPTPTNGQVLTYSSLTSKWIASTVATFSKWLVDDSNGFLYNDTDTIYFNATFLNDTIDTRAIITEVDPVFTSENTSLARIGNCAAGEVVVNITTDGVECSSAGTGDITSVQGDNIYIYNGSNSGDVVLVLNETKLNETITDLNTDTTYTNGSNISLVGTTFSLNTISVKTWLDTLYAGISTIFDGAYSSLTGTPTLLSNFTDDLGDRGYDSLSNFTNDAGYITSYTETDPLWSGNQSSYSTTADIVAFGYYNSSDFVITDYFTKTQIENFGYYNSSDFDIADYYLNSNPASYWNDSYATFNKTYADGLYADISVISNNESWNESYANTIYAPINYGDDWNKTYADTLYYAIDNPSGFYNSTDFSIDDYLTASQVLGFGYYNSTDFVITDYYTKSQIDNFNYYNSSDFVISDYYPVTNPANYWNDSYATFNESYADGLYVDRDGDSLNGTFNLSDGVLRIQDEARLVVYDTGNEAHLVDADLTKFDELRNNVFTDQLNINTFYNATGDYINISSISGGDITFISNYGGNAVSESFDGNEFILPLIAGTEETPVLNRVYARIIAGEATWFVSITEPTETHAMVSRVLLGESGTDPYAASLQEDGSNGILKRVQRTFRKQGLFYNDGFDYVATSDDLQIGTGEFINGIYDQETSTSLNVTEGFYLVRSDGTYEKYTDFLNISQYSDGTDIGTNKYFNVIFGITPFDGNGHIYAVVQKNPVNGDYTSVADAYADGDAAVNIYPSDEFLKIFFLPIARVIINEGDGAELLPNGYYAEDYRGGIAGGVSSGGGLTETDPIWTEDKVNYFTSTEVLDFNYYNSSDFSISDYYLASNPASYWNDSYATFNKTYADSLYATVNYGDDWNKTYADSLYYDISNPSGFYNSTDFSIGDYPTTSDVIAFGYYNSTDFVISDYYPVTNPSNYYNITNAPIYINDTFAGNYSDYLTLFNWNKTYADTLYYDIDNPSGFYNSSDFSISDYFTKTNVLNFNYYNSSDFSISDYYLASNPASYWNDTYATFNKTYADSLYRTEDWNNFTGIPTATPSNGDTTHLSTADQIYDWATGLFTQVGDIVTLVGNWSLDKTSYLNATESDELYVNISGDTMTGDLNMDGNFFTNSIQWVSLYDPSSLYNNFLPSFSDTLFYGNSRGISITSNRALSSGSLNNLFNLDNANNAQWQNVNSLNPVIINITYNSNVWGDGPFLNDFEQIYSWRNTNAINYTVEILHDSNDDSIYTWQTKCTVTNNDDYIQLCNINTWRVRTIRLNITAAGDGDLAESLRIGTLQAKSSVSGDATGHLANRYTNTFYGNQTIEASLNVTGLIDGYYKGSDVDSLISSTGNWTADKSDYSTTTEANLLYAPINYGDDWNKTYADSLYADISVVSNPFDQTLNTTSNVDFNNATIEECIVFASGGKICSGS